MGVPVVTTNVSAIPELVEDGRTGLLVPPCRPELLAAAIERMLTDRALRQRVIEAARQRIISDFDNRELSRSLAAIYRSQIQESQKASEESR